MQTLTLGLVSGPVEGILTLCVVYAITAYTYVSALHYLNDDQAYADTKAAVVVAIGNSQCFTLLAFLI